MLQRGKEYVTTGGLRGDLIAGVVTGGVLVPQSMSYALLANLPPQYGVYSAVSLVVYFLLGTSPKLSVAPVAMSSLLVGGYTAAFESERDRVLAAGTMAFFVGVLQLGFGLTRLGSFFSTWLSKTMLLGYSSGVALTIIISQLPSMFGLSVPQGQFPIYNFGLCLSELAHTKPIAFGFFLVSFLVLYSAQRVLKPRLRANWRYLADLVLLLVIVVGTVVSFAVIEFAGVLPKTQLPVVGPIPTGVPTPALPSLAEFATPGLVGTAVAIAIVAFSEGFSTATNVAPNKLVEVNANRELFAFGMSNLVSSMFNGYVVSGGMGRTMVNVNSGAVSQVSGLVAYLVSVLCLLFAAPAVQYIPKALLAAVILAAVLGMIKTTELKQLYRISKLDFAVSACTLVVVVCVGPMYGIAFGVAMSVCCAMVGVAAPHIVELGEMRGNMLRGLRRYPDEAKRIPGVVVVRVDSPLFFANSTLFFSRCKALIAAREGGEDEGSDRIRAFLVEASGIGFIDTSALHDLLRFQQYLAKKDIHFVLAEVRGPVRDAIERFNKATAQSIAPFYEHLPQAGGGEAEAAAAVVVPAADGDAATPSNAVLTCFSVHTMQEALEEIRSHHLGDSHPPAIV